jgi:hypothetical protein
MAHKYEVDMIRENEVLATAVFSDIQEARNYINGHGDTEIKFTIYELVNGQRLSI